MNAKQNGYLLRDELGAVERLALAYAPASSRRLWLGYLVLENRLARAVQGASEPIMAQIRLAWWRERFNEPASQWPAGEPLLSELALWGQEQAALTGLVDGWEAREIGEDSGVQLRAARVEALLALARLAGGSDDPLTVRQVVLDWTDGALGEGLGEGGKPRLSRAMRPLAILRALAIHEGQGGSPWQGLLITLRIGCFGR